MPRMQVGAITLEYDVQGPADGQPLLLISGLGSQLTRWDDNFCGRLVAHGFKVIRFDNRDIGLSTHLDGVPVPDIQAVAEAKQRGETPTVPYMLDDMAKDAVGLLAGLGITSAHIVGASMGGMIAQLVAANHPEFTRSLTSIMSTTGNPDLPPATEAAMKVLTTPAPSPKEDEAAWLASAMHRARTIGSPGYPTEEGALRRRLTDAMRRDFDPAGVGRQFAAIVAGPDRGARLRQVTAPTLVLHGADDPLVPVEGGKDTAARIKGAELIVIDGWGHDLPVELYGRMTDAIAKLAARS